MAFTDWTYTGTGTCELDASIKYAGNSSCKMQLGTSVFTHNTFSKAQSQVILWTYVGSVFGSNQIYVNLSTYGDLSVRPSAINTWNKFRVSFWYDLVNNTKWARIELWNGASWDQVGTDTNFGAGAPSSGTLSLKASGSATFYGWFDELEVYS